VAAAEAEAKAARVAAAEAEAEAARMAEAARVAEAAGVAAAEAKAEAAGVAAAEAAGGRREQFSAPKLPHGEARFALRTSGRSTSFVRTKVGTPRPLRAGLVDIGRLRGLKCSE
jgi:hypothetical protein